MRAFWVVVGGEKHPPLFFPFPQLYKLKSKLFDLDIFVIIIFWLPRWRQMQWMSVEPGILEAELCKLGFLSWKVRVAESLPRLASHPFPCWQWLHVKWLHSWTVNSKACAPTAAWQEEVIFCVELSSLLSSSDLKNNFKKAFPPHIFSS